MKQILTKDITEGVRLPFSNRSLDHLQEALQECIKGVVSSYQTNLNSVVILSGVNSHATGYTEGYAFYNGKIYYVEPSSDLSDPANAELRVKKTYRIGDPVLFSDNVTRNVHEIENLEVVNAAALGKVNAMTRIKKKVDDNSTPWQPVSFTGGYSGSLKVRRNGEGKVEFKGSVDITGGGTVQLPDGFRPNYVQLFNVAAAEDPTLASYAIGYALIRIDPSGEIRTVLIDSTSAASIHLIYPEAISFFPA